MLVVSFTIVVDAVVGWRVDGVAVVGLIEVVGKRVEIAAVGLIVVVGKRVEEAAVGCWVDEIIVAFIVDDVVAGVGADVIGPLVGFGLEVANPTRLFVISNSV